MDICLLKIEGLIFIFVLVEFKHTEFFASYGALFAKHQKFLVLDFQ